MWLLKLPISFKYVDDGSTFKCATAITTASTDWKVELKTIPGQHFVGGILKTGSQRIIRITTEGYENPANADAPHCAVYFDDTLPKITAGANVTLQSPAAVSDVTDAVDHLGFGVGGIAYPSLVPQSGWGTALSPDELEVGGWVSNLRVATTVPARQKNTTQFGSSQAIYFCNNQQSHSRNILIMHESL